MSPEEKIVELGLTLPPALPARFSYIPYRRVGDLLFLAGHGPRFANDTYRLGKLVDDSQIARGYADAQLTGLNILATLKSVVGELDRVVAIVKMLGLVNAAPTFKKHPLVINGCSDLLMTVLGDAGRHARSSIGVSSLPHDMSVEIEVIVQVAS
jgi:enamine deaminase RidA (YjgF/YER057c/UK114 family)